MTDDEEDLIESEEPSPAMSKLRQRWNRLVPAKVGRRFLGSVTVAAMTLGLVAGYVVGATPWDDATVGASDSSTAATHDPNNIPFVPDAVPTEDGVTGYSLVAPLTLGDLTALGERPLISGSDAVSGLAGLCAADPQAPTGADPTIDNGAAYGIAFDLPDAWLSVLISPYLDVLAASTLRGRVELARTCQTGRFTAQTDGVMTGIGDEYAAFTVRHSDPGAVGTSIVVLVRVGGQLIEITMNPAGTEVTGGLPRALRIAEVAVARMLAG